jgi:hypothetical protein
MTTARLYERHEYQNSVRKVGETVKQGELLSPRKVPQTSSHQTLDQHQSDAGDQPLGAAKGFW